MKGLEKLTSVRLAEVLSQKGVVPTEAITDALYAQDKMGEPFVQLLINGGHITEWDLSKVVTESFQLPFIMASNYEVSSEARDRIDTRLLFPNLLVPLDVFDKLVIVVMPILTSFEVFAKIQKQADCELFPYVGLVSENRKVMGELYVDFNDWHKEDQKRREAVVTRKTNAGSKKKEGDWMSIFDAGDQAIKQTLGDRKGD